MTDQQDRLLSAMSEIERQARADRIETAILAAMGVASIVIALGMAVAAVMWGC